VLAAAMAVVVAERRSGSTTTPTQRLVSAPTSDLGYSLSLPRDLHMLYRRPPVGGPVSPPANRCDRRAIWTARSVAGR